MAIEQITIFLENRPGRLSRITNVLSEEDIEIKVMAVSETAEFGILHLIVADTEKTYSVLKDQGFSVKKTLVTVVEVKENPKDIHRIMMLVRKAEINIEYMYTFTNWGKNILILRFDQPENGKALLTDSGISLISGDL